MSDADGLNVTEAAAFLGVSRTTVYGLLRKGAIPHRVIGTQPRFSRTALSIWLGGEPLAAILAAIAVAAQAPPAAPTAAPTRPAHRRTPKVIRGRLPPSPVAPRPQETARDRS